MNEYRVSYRYAHAFLENAMKEGKADEIFDDFQKVKRVINASSEFKSMLASPVFQLWRKKKIVQAVFEEIKISPMALDFLQLLVDKRRGVLLTSIIYQYEVQYNALNKRLMVEIISAVELSDEIKNNIIAKLADWTKMTILPTYTIKKDIIGGMLVRIDDWIFDASLANQLEVLHAKLIA